MSAPSTCYRCDYDLRDIADNSPCPECGLLAIRSRRESDELRNTRPAYLRSLAIGNWLVIVAVLMLLASSFALNLLFNWLAIRRRMSGLTLLVWTIFKFTSRDFILLVIFNLAATVLLVGVRFLTRPEQYPSAGQADAGLRGALRLVALGGWLGSFLPLIPTAPQYLRQLRIDHLQLLEPILLYGGLTLLALSAIALPWLLFKRLRGVAVRSPSAHLAEHCTLVGIFASASVLWSIFLLLFDTHTSGNLLRAWERSTAWLLLHTLDQSIRLLILFWSLYVLVRFAISFACAARAQRADWRRDDRGQ